MASRALRGGLDTRLVNAAELLGRSDFALNPSILTSVQAIAGAEVVTFSRDGRVLASSAGDARARALIAAATRQSSAIGLLAEAAANPVIKDIDCEGPCTVAVVPLATRPGAGVAVIGTRRDLAAVTRAVTRTILVAALASLALMIAVGAIVARRVTAPLDELVTFVQRVAVDADARRPTFGEDEVSRLGRAFDEMLVRLAAAREALVRSEKLSLAGVLAARVAHDVRNPLFSIKMHTQMLKARRAGTPDERSIDAVLYDIVQIESVIRGLIEVARPADVTLAPVQLNGVVRGVFDHLSLQLEHRRVALVLDLQPDLPLIPLDEERFRQALMNVAVNAAEAVTAGGTIAVRTSLDAGGSTVVVDVCDDGVGVDPSIASRLFDPFVSTKRDGVGLGLVNTRAVLESHGGRVAITPRQPHGTCVTLTLPAAEASRG